jgi:hypothetical protein
MGTFEGWSDEDLRTLVLTAGEIASHYGTGTDDLDGDDVLSTRQRLVLRKAARAYRDALGDDEPADWKQIKGTGYRDQEADVAYPFYAQVGPEDNEAGTWSWTLLMAGADGFEYELTGSGSAAVASEDRAKLAAEAAGLGALAVYELGKDGDLP